MSSSFSGLALLKRVACVAVALAAFVPLGAFAHRAHEHEQPAESHRAANQQRHSVDGTAHAVSRSCPGGSDSTCCCTKLPFSSSTVRVVPVVTAALVMALPYITSRFAPLVTDEELPALRSLPAAPPRGPPLPS